MLVLLLGIAVVRAQPTVAVPTDAPTLAEALALVDEGGTIFIEADMDLAEASCAPVFKNVSIVGQGAQPVVPGLFPQDVVLNLDNLTIDGACVGRRSTWQSSDEVNARLIVHGGQVSGSNLALPGHPGYGVVLSDAIVELTGLEASNYPHAVFYATVAQGATALRVADAVMDANEDGVILGMRSDTTDPPLTILVEDSRITQATGDPVAVALVQYADLAILRTTISGLGADGGAIPTNGLINSFGGSVLIEGSALSDCVGSNNGAIVAQGLGDTVPTAVQIRDTTIDRCGGATADSVGGLLYAADIDVVLDNVVAREVFAGEGALLWQTHGEILAIRDLTVLDYTAGSRGAIVAEQVNNVQLTRARLCGGVTGEGSAGLESVYAVDTLLRNLIVQDLESPDGAAVEIVGGALALHNSTFAGNATQELLVYDGRDLSVFNNIFSGSPGAVGVRILQTPTVWLGGYNLWYDLTANTSGFSDLEDPSTDLYASPAFVDAWRPDSCAILPRLAEGSPAIDAGNPDPILNDPDGSRGDIGALGGPEGGWAEQDTGVDDSGDDSGDDSDADDSSGDDSGTPDTPGSKPVGCAGCASSPVAPAAPGLLLALVASRRRRFVEAV